MVVRTRTGSWQIAAQLRPVPLPGAELAGLHPPELLLAALGNQLQKHRRLTMPSTAGMLFCGFAPRLHDRLGLLDNYHKLSKGSRFPYMQEKKRGQLDPCLHFLSCW